MEKAVSNFAREFKHWEIQLPEASVRERRRGKIVQRGWTIWYLFDADERGEYIDYYAMHRMTNDRHVRLYADGGSKGMDAIESGWSHGPDDDAAEQARKEAEFNAYNQRVSRELNAKGFGIAGDEHPSAIINRWLQTGGAGADEASSSADGRQDTESERKVDARRGRRRTIQVKIAMATFERLKRRAEPLEDTVDTVINRLLDDLERLQ